MRATSIETAGHAQAFAESVRLVFEELAALSVRGMAAELNARQVPSPTGGKWHPTTVVRVRERLARGAPLEGPGRCPTADRLKTVSGSSPQPLRRGILLIRPNLPLTRTTKPHLALTVFADCCFRREPARV